MLEALLPSSTTRVIVYLKPISMRWGCTKLREVCTDVIGISPDSFTAFVFTNSRRDCLLLYATDYEGDQTILKKLERGAFLLPAPAREDEPFVIMKPSILARLFR